MEMDVNWRAAHSWRQRALDGQNGLTLCATDSAHPQDLSGAPVLQPQKIIHDSNSIWKVCQSCRFILRHQNAKQGSIPQYSRTRGPDCDANRASFQTAWLCRNYRRAGGDIPKTKHPAQGGQPHNLHNAGQYAGNPPRELPTGRQATAAPMPIMGQYRQRPRQKLSQGSPETRAPAGRLTTAFAGGICPSHSRCRTFRRCQSPPATHR